MSIVLPYRVYVTELLDLVARADAHDLLMWEAGPMQAQELTFFLRCGDLFDWDHDDVEAIDDSCLKRLQRAVADVIEVSPDAPRRWGMYLYIARTRRQRPHPSAYPHEHPAVGALLDLAGPGRQFDVFAGHFAGLVPLGDGSFVAETAVTPASESV